jgi:hypothetical protein
MPNNLLAGDLGTDARSAHENRLAEGRKGQRPGPKESTGYAPDEQFHDQARLDDAPGTLRISASSALPLPTGKGGGLRP